MITKNLADTLQEEGERELSTTYLKKVIGMLGYRIISIINAHGEIIIKIKKES